MNLFKDVPLVVYHANCTDGLAAAAAFLSYFKGEVEVVAGSYNKPFDVSRTEGRVIYLVDFSFSREILKQICSLAKFVVLLDHHVSALSALKGLSEECPNFSMEHSTVENSGAVIAWRYVLGDTAQVPRIVELIEDRDLWKFDLPETKAVHESLSLLDRTPKAFLDAILADDVEGLAAKGDLLLEAFNKNVESILKQCTRVIKIGNLEIYAANASGMFASEVGNRLYAKQLNRFSATYYDTADSRNFSLRSGPQGLDVSIIAKDFGGGGHRNASGFIVSRDHPLAKI